MSKWEKHIPQSGRAWREKFAISKNRRGNAYLIVPFEIAPPASKADYYKQGTKLAVRFCEDGQYTVCRSSKLAIPRPLAGPVPLGTQDVTYKTDGDLYVFDLEDLKETIKAKTPEQERRERVAKLKREIKELEEE